MRDVGRGLETDRVALVNGHAPAVQADRVEPGTQRVDLVGIRVHGHDPERGSRDHGFEQCPVVHAKPQGVPFPAAGLHQVVCLLRDGRGGLDRGRGVGQFGRGPPLGRKRQDSAVEGHGKELPIGRQEPHHFPLDRDRPRDLGLRTYPRTGSTGFQPVTEQPRWLCYRMGSTGFQPVTEQPRWLCYMGQPGWLCYAAVLG